MAKTETGIEERIAAASKLLGRATAKLQQTDPEIAERVYRVLANEMQQIREGK